MVLEDSADLLDRANELLQPFKEKSCIIWMREHSLTSSIIP
jgi:hypothetical protein